MKVKFYVSLCVCVMSFFLISRSQAQMKEATVNQIKLLLQEKESRTPAQKKIGSQLLQASREQRGEKMVIGVDLEPAQVKTTVNGLVKVDMNAEVSDALLQKITSLGGQIIYPSKEYKTIQAMVPLAKVETIAGFSEVRFIQTAIESRTVGTPLNLRTGKDVQKITTKDKASIVEKRRSMPERLAKMKKQIQDYLMVLGSGSVNSQGDHSHRADDARNAFGYAGQGMKIGVLSDSYNALGGAPADVLTDDLPGVGNPFGNTTPVTVLADYASGEDEGRAMLQIVHDLAPKAQLYFATGNVGGTSGFAANIKALRDAGCDVVIDDLGYYNEPCFQDGTVAKAVQYVVGTGGMYFSSAGNEGAKLLGTSGVWEGDFTDAGSPAISTVITGITKTGGTIHNFGTVSSPRIGDSVTTIASGYYNLQWADPVGASSNDYDLFMINAAGAVKYSSTTTQNGTQDPYEQFAAGTLASGDRLVVFKAASAAVRAINVNTNRGVLKVSTTGQTHGHSAIPDAYCVAAIAATGVPFVSTNPIETFTSDGPRRLFYDTLGNALVAGSNFTFASGKYITRLKPDITAADGVSTTLPASTGLNPFYGTSAAAPHAGAIAALLKSAKPTITPAQVRTILTTTALDILAPGYDSVSGYGVLQAYQAMVSLNPTPAPIVSLGTSSVTEAASGNGNGQLDPGEVGNLFLQLLNSTPTTATNVVAKVTSTTAGVTVTNGTVSYGNIAGNGSLTNTTPFTFAVNQSVACGTVITFQVLVTFGGGGPSPVGFTVTTTLGQKTFASLSAAIGSPAATTAVFTSLTGAQTGRIVRGTVASTCAAPVANPGLTIVTGARQYDSYVFTNTTGASQCFTVTMNSTNGANIYTAAYNATGFVPANPSTNYVAEPGQSSTSQVYSFTVAAGAKFTVVVHSVDSLSNTAAAGNEVGTPYTLGITYISCTPKTTCTPIAVTTATLPNGAIGTAYNQHIVATGASGVYVDSLSGNLPAGLVFAGDSLSGTPTQAGTFAITVKVTDPTGTCPGATMGYKLFIAGDSATSITATAGNGQTAIPGQAFATALQATVRNISNAPLSGVNVTFTAPASGASGTFAGGSTTAIVVTNASGVATAPVFTSNTTLGAYTVTATVNNIAPASFNLTNACPATLVTTSADSGPGSLRYIVANACAGATITFDPSVTAINLTSGEIPIVQSVTINGNGANVTSISGSNLSRIFLINATTTSAISISGLTIKNGKPQATGVGSANSSNGGGGILITAGNTLTVNTCYFLNNDASLTDYGEGGGIDNESTVTVTITNSGFTANNAPEDGGGVAHWGTKVMTLSNCTFANNTSIGDATGNHPDGWGGGLLIANGSVSGNTTAGGATLTNCTFSGNSAILGGNIFKNNGTFRIGGTIVGGGVITGTVGKDILQNYGTITSNGYNLVQFNDGGYSLATANNTQGVNPKLLPLANYGGIMPTILPMSSSVAINGANPTAPTLTVDQRGFARVTGGRADMGAVETNYAAAIVAGTPQSTDINTAFATALQARVTESGNNIAGDSVTFSAPATGATGTFTGTRTKGVVTDASGLATAPTFTANGTAGTYRDTASIGSAFTGLLYVLTNNAVPIAFTGCPNINLIVSRPGYNTYNGEPVSIYNFDTATGAATVIPGGPIKDATSGNNIDVNGAGVNAADGFLYAIRDTINTAGTSAAPILYRIGSNYVSRTLGTLPTPTLSTGENLGVVVPAAGTFDDAGNYYYIAMTGAYSFTTNSFVPSGYYVGKVTGVAALTAGTGALNASFTKISFANAPVAFQTALTKTITSASGSGAGSNFQDITYSNLYRSIYVYGAYNVGAAYSGQLFAINPTTGAATFYANPPAFGAANNEVAGISTTASGNLRVFTTSGDIYKPVMNGAGTDFTSTLVKVGTSGVPLLGVSGSVRGDLASCATGATTLPASRPSTIVIGLPNQIVAYPNPAQGLTTITVGLPLTNATVRLLGASGNVISELSGVSGYTFQLDMTGKSGGMYTVEVIQGGSTQVVKVIKP